MMIETECAHFAVCFIIDRRIVVPLAALQECEEPFENNPLQDAAGAD